MYHFNKWSFLILQEKNKIIFLFPLGGFEYLLFHHFLLELFLTLFCRCVMKTFYVPELYSIRHHIIHTTRKRIQ